MPAGASISENGEEQMPEKLKTNYVDHISIAVRNLKEAEEDFRHTFGWEVDGRGQHPFELDLDKRFMG